MQCTFVGASPAAGVLRRAEQVQQEEGGKPVPMAPVEQFNAMYLSGAAAGTASGKGAGAGAGAGAPKGPFKRLKVVFKSFNKENTAQ